MGCIYEKRNIKLTLHRKIFNHHNQFELQPSYANSSYRRHTQNIENGVHSPANRIRTVHLDEVADFVTSKLIQLSNSICSKSSISCLNNYLGRHSLSLYAASSVILALCYLTTTSAATSETTHPIFAEGKSDKEILDHLLKNSRYDKRLLPPVDGTLTVNVNVLLLSLASPDESSLKYEVEFLLNQQWYDPRLRYANQSKYEFLNAIHHHEDIWLPDTYFIMHGDFKDPIIPMHFALRIYRNGTITYAMRRHLILSCQGSLNIFPFDDPLCSFAMESISYELSHIKYVWKNDEDTLRKSPSLTTLNAYLIKNATITCPIKGSWRGVTTMLNFFTTSNGFRSTLPVVSNLTAMNVWDGVCMCFIYASLLEFVCVNYVGRKRPLHNVVYRPGENPVTQRLPAVLSRIGIILASPLEVIEQEFITALSTTDKTNQSTGQTMADYEGSSQTHTDTRVPMNPTQTIVTTNTSQPRREDSLPYSNEQISPGIPFLLPSDSVANRADIKEPAVQYPVKPPRRKSSRVTTIDIDTINCKEIVENAEFGGSRGDFGEKKREASGPNEIVSCTSCGAGTSPCTHTANNGCATETCFVQVRKKEPPHPIRVAKTIDVIARITFPTAYSVFLIFFFIHYKGFS